MVTLLLDSAQLEIVLSGTERALTLHRGNIMISRSDIVKVQLSDDLWTWLRGVKSPGVYIPGVVAAGTWKSVAGDDFVLVRKHKPGVVIDCTEDAPFQRLMLSTSHALALVNALRLDVTDEASDVVTLTSPIPVIPPPRQTHKPPTT